MTITEYMDYYGEPHRTDLLNDTHSDGLSGPTGDYT